VLACSTTATDTATAHRMLGRGREERAASGLVDARAVARRGFATIGNLQLRGKVKKLQAIAILSQLNKLLLLLFFFTLFSRSKLKASSGPKLWFYLIFP